MGGKQIPKIVISDPKGEVRKFMIEKKTYILGRDKSNDIELYDETASRKHAKINFCNGGPVIEDIGNTAEVYLNNKRIINKAFFEAGDQIQIGSTQVTVEMDATDNEVTKRIDIADIHPLFGKHKKAPDLTIEAEARFCESREKLTPLASAVTEPEETLFMIPGDIKTRLEGPRLILISGDLGENIHPLNHSKIMIGRDIGCHIQIDEKAVSNYHAMILKRGNRYYLKDLGSKNGVVINGSIVNERKRLRDGDKIAISHTVFTFFDENASPYFLEKLPVLKRKYITITLALFSVFFITLFIFLEQQEPHAQQSNGAVAQLSTDSAEPADPNVVQRTAHIHFSAGEKFLEKKLWDEAVSHYEKGLKINPGNSDAQEAIQKAKLERTCRDSIEKGRSLIDAHRYSAGVEMLKKIPVHSIYYDEAFIRILTAQDESNYRVKSNTGFIRTEPSTDSEVMSKVKKGETLPVLMTKGKWFQVLLKTGERGWAHNSILQKDHILAGSKKTSMSQLATIRSEKSAYTSEDKGIQLTEKALQHYINGRIEPSIKLLDQALQLNLPSNSAVKTLASTIKQRVMIIAALYEDGLNQYSNNRTGQAFRTWSKVLKHDREMVGETQSHISNQISSHTGRMFYQLAQQAYDKGNYKEAGNNCSQALRAQKGHEGCVEMMSALSK